MQRPSGAAWAALGRDSAHMRTNSNALPSGAVSPVGPGHGVQSNDLERALSGAASSGSETLVEHTPGTSGMTRTQSSTGGFPSGRHTSRSPLLNMPPPTMERVSASQNLSPGFPAQQPPVWRKVLYEKQPFEDNYVDAAFMQQLRTNTHLRALDYREIMRATFAILQQLNIIVLFIVIYAASLQGVISPRALVTMDATLISLALVGYVAITNGRFSLRTLFEPAKKTVVVTGVLLFLSPVFHTLTRSYTDDTIWALSILLGFIHVVFADYEYLNGQSSDYTHNLSMNAAIVAVTLLASRVADPVAAAALIGVGILGFTLSPILRHHIRRVSVEAHEFSSLILCGVVIGCLVQLHAVLAGVFVVVVFVLTVAMPSFFVRVQSGRYKTQIQGPWDEARPQNSAAAAEWANAGLLS